MMCKQASQLIVVIPQGLCRLFPILALVSLLPASPLVVAQETNLTASSATNVTEKITSLWTRPGEDWPVMLGKDGRSTSNEKGIATNWPNGKPPLVWYRKAPKGYGNGVVSQGRWFHSEREGFYERLVCLNAETGEQLWKWDSAVEYVDMYGYSSGPRCSPVADDQQVYFYGVTGTLAAIDIATGKPVWKHFVNKEYGVIQNFFGVGTTPILYKNLVLVMVGGSPEESQKVQPGQLQQVKPNGSAMVAFDRETGEEVYRVGNYLASYSTPIIANFGGKDYCLAFMREGLMVFEPETGIECDFFPWRSERLESVNAASPVVVGDEIFITETYEIGSVRLKFNDGKLKQVWKDSTSQKKQLMRAHWSTPIAVGDYMFGCSGRNEPDADLRCIDWKNGKVMWAENTRSRSTLLQIDGHFLVLFEDGIFDIIKANPKKFEKVAEIDFSTWKPEKEQRALLENPSWAPPVFSHGYLYLRGPQFVCCIDLSKK